MEIQDKPQQTDPAKDPLTQINRALGLFISFFGVVVLISILLTETRLGKMTNLGAGLILLAIGVIMVFRPGQRPKRTGPGR